MASSLSGLIRTLIWSDFPHRQGTAPTAGHSATAAFTSSSFQASGASFHSVAGSHPAHFQLVDNISLTVKFNGHQSFVMSWLFSRPQQFQTDMLNHEQQHYNITALVSRDFFVDVMLLKHQNFANARAGISAVRLIRQRSLNKIGNIQTLYDQEVHPEQNSGQSRGPIQQNWDRFVQTAFTQARSPASQAPDGTSHKVRLVEVLTQNGKVI